MEPFKKTEDLLRVAGLNSDPVVFDRDVTLNGAIEYMASRIEKETT